jgi:hypothetical protein
MTAIRRSSIVVLVLLLMLFSLGIAVHAKEKPEIVRLDAEYTEMLIKINVHWQSPNPVTVIRAIVGKEQKELKVDEYDNRRNPDGYTGEAVIVVNAVPTAGREGIPYVVQIEDDLRQKSEQVTGSVVTPTGFAVGGAAPYPGAAGAGAGVWTASGAWSAAGTGPPPGGGWPAGSGGQQGSVGWPAAGTGQGSGGWPAGGGAQGGSWPPRGTGQTGGGWPAGTGQPGSTGWPAGSTGGSYGGSPSAGDAWSKAQQGRPGELIDKTIGFVAGSGMGAGGPANAPGASPFPAGTGGAGLLQTLQNEKFGPGGKASFVGGLNPGDEVAVVLGPVNQPFTVTKVLFLFGGSPGKGIVTLKISQEPSVSSAGGVLFSQSFEVQGADTAFQEVDLALMGGVVSAQAGSVRVSFQVQHSGLPGIGYDMNANAIPGRNWINRSGVWSDFGTAGIRGNGIVRAAVAQ